LPESRRGTKIKAHVPRTPVLATLNLLAFAFHTVCELAEDLWRQAMQQQARRSRFFEHLRSITVFLVFPSWRDLLETLAFAKPPPQPP